MRAGKQQQPRHEYLHSEKVEEWIEYNYDMISLR